MSGVRKTSNSAFICAPLGASGKKSGVAVIHRASGSPYMLARTRRVTSLIAMGAVIVGTIVA